MANFRTVLPDGRLLIDAFEEELANEYCGNVPYPNYKTMTFLLGGPDAYREKFKEEPPGYCDIKFQNEYAYILRKLLSKTEVPQDAKWPLTKEFNNLWKWDGEKSGTEMDVLNNKKGIRRSVVRVRTEEDLLIKIDEVDLLLTAVLDTLYRKNNTKGMKTIYSFQQIAEAMGMVKHGQHMATSQQKKLLDRLMRQNGTQIAIKDEKTGGGVIGSLTPLKIRCERDGGIVNGRWCKWTVEQLDRSVAFTHAQSLREIDSIPLAALRPPAGKTATDRNMKIGRLIRDVLLHAKHRRLPCVEVKHDTMMKNTNTTRSNLFKLKKDMLLWGEHYCTEISWLLSCQETDTGLMFYLRWE